MVSELATQTIRDRLEAIRAIDSNADLALFPKLASLRSSRFYNDLPRQRILIVGIRSPQRPMSLETIFNGISESRHDIVFDLKDTESFGKLHNTNLVVARHDLANFDWLWMVDDDVILPERFVDDFVALCLYAELRIAGPAHRALSFKSHQITQRHDNALVRITNFVEIGPVLALHHETFSTLLPLPDLRFGWGVDLTWPLIADRHGWKMGIVDACALCHTSRPGEVYDWDAAVAEAQAYMAPYGLSFSAQHKETRLIIRAVENS